jgi:hypothetical protein
VYSLSLLVFAEVSQRHEDGAGREENGYKDEFSHFIFSYVKQAYRGLYALGNAQYFRKT